MRQLYIIAVCNGAGKTTASYTILPNLLNCQEFVNADEIARGLSPFQPEKAAIQGGRLMLARIATLLEAGETFAFETTLSSKSYITLVNRARQKGYHVMLLFLWIRSQELAASRVKRRVQEGGHDVPEDVIRRRYEAGLKNFFRLYKPVVDEWLFIDNSGEKPYELIAGGSDGTTKVSDSGLWIKLKSMYDGQ